MNKLLLEAKNLDIYKKLLAILGDWCNNVPGTGISKWLDTIIEKGVSAIPGDKRAQAILAYILEEQSPASAVQFLTNWNFSDLPYDLKPVYKVGNKHVTAFWKTGKMASHKVKDLLAVDTKGGSWVDENNKKVTLIDMARELENK